MQWLERYNSALCTHWADPAPATPASLCGFWGINAPIETGAGQFWKCWDIKKATFYDSEGLQHKAAPSRQQHLNMTELEQMRIDCK